MISGRWAGARRYQSRFFCFVYGYGFSDLRATKFKQVYFRVSQTININDTPRVNVNDKRSIPYHYTK